MLNKKHTMFSFKESLLTVFLFIIGVIPALADSKDGFICKAYISMAYGRSINIINHYKTGSDGVIYVKYKRNDKKTFSYACDVGKNTIVYTAWDKFSNNWGRWRSDEKGNYIITGKTLTIIDTMNGKKRFTLP